MKKHKKLLSVCFTLLIVVFCAFLFFEPIMFRVYGINKIKSFSKYDYDKTVEKIKVLYPKNSFFIISNKERFQKYIDLGKSENQKYNLSQPIQALYFNNCSIISYHVNCYAEGSFLTGKLNWNTNNRFDYYYPKTAIEDMNINLYDILSIYEIDYLNNIDVIVFWNHVFEKNSIELIKVIKDNNYVYNRNSNLNILFINTDESFLF